MNLVNLNDPNVRDYMLDEFKRDEASGTVYISNRIKAGREQDYCYLMKNAIQNGTPQSLAQDILTNGILKTHETRNTKKGPKSVKVPVTAHETMSEGEFNRFYIRGICRKAIQQNKQIKVYRAKPVHSPRSSSTRMIGDVLNPASLLVDLRMNPGVNTAFGLPKGPNSGLSGEII